MRRNQRALINIFCFVTLLVVVLFVNRTSSSVRGFAWTTIRYSSSTLSHPPSRGICPSLSRTKPALVVARVEADGDPKWLKSLSDRYDLCVYTADAPTDLESTHLQVPENRGHEAMAYLTFIIDNYDNIPEAGVVFVHGSRWSWHNDHPDYDNFALLTALNVSAALTPLGYHNLRCDWSASTCDASSAPPQGSLENSFRAVLQPYDPRVISDSALPYSLAILFGGHAHKSAEGRRDLLLGRGDAVRSQCCAQFAAARESIWQHSRNEYLALRQWLLDGSNRANANQGPLHENAAPSDDRVAGRILSYLWHILFIRQESRQDGKIDLQQLNKLACPRADECYCRLYGRCNLPGCANPAQCYGQYRIPPDFKLPDNWAAIHG